MNQNLVWSKIKRHKTRNQMHQFVFSCMEISKSKTKEEIGLSLERSGNALEERSPAEPDGLLFSRIKVVNKQKKPIFCPELSSIFVTMTNRWEEIWRTDLGRFLTRCFEAASKWWRSTGLQIQLLDLELVWSVRTDPQMLSMYHWVALISWIYNWKHWLIDPVSLSRFGLLNV